MKYLATILLLVLVLLCLQVTSAAPLEESGTIYIYDADAIIDFTTYYFMALFQYDNTVLNGAEGSFKTSREPRPPTVTTKNATNITTTAATLNMAYDFMAHRSVQVQFKYKAEGASAWDETGWVSKTRSSSHSFSESIAGLSSGTTYYFMAQLKYDGTVLNGTEKSFTTSSESRAPTVSTKKATNITTAAATLNMAYDFMDYSSVQVQFRYKAEGASAWNETGWVSQTGSGSHSFSEPIAGLSSGTTYYFMAQLKYDSAMLNGTENSFTTSSESRPPTVNTKNATNITTASATLNMAYDFMDYSSVHVQFRYKAEGASGWDETGWVAQSGSGTHSFAESTVSLSSGTTHYFMAQLKYDGTVLNGTENSFTTSSESRPPTVSTKNATNITAVSATLNMAYGFMDYRSAHVQFRYKAEGASAWDETGWVSQTGSGSHSFSEPIAGLSSGTTYYFVAMLQYDSTVLNGTESTFTTSGEPKTPTVTTKNATNITTASATLNMAYDFMDYSSVLVQFMYKAEGASGWHETGWVSQAGYGSYSFSEPIAGLYSNMTYYFMAQLKYDGTVLNGTEISFTTSGELRQPTVTTKNVTNITTASATLNMTYDFMDYSLVHIQFRYKVEGVNAWNETGWVAQTGSGTHSFSETIAGLSSNMTYYFMAQLKYGSTVLNGTANTFTTSSEPRPPAVTTENATNITTASATLNMAYDFMDYSSVHVQFRYKAEGASAWNEAGWVSQTGSGSHSFSEPIAGLSSNMTYYFSAQLKYNSAVLNGTEISFTTSGEPRPPAVTTENATNITTASTTLNMAYDFMDHSSVQVQVQFKYKAEGASGWDETGWVSQAGYGSHSFSESIAGLSSNRTYYFMAQLKYDSAMLNGTEISFTTSGELRQPVDTILIYNADAVIDITASIPPDDTLDSSDALPQEEVKTILIYNADAVIDITASTPADDALDSSDALPQDGVKTILIYNADAFIYHTASTPADDTLNSSDALPQDGVKAILIYNADAFIDITASTPPDDALDSSDALPQDGVKTILIYNADATCDFNLGTAFEHPPTANAGGPYPGNVNEDIQFYGKGTDPDGDAIVAYAWDFNNDEITDSTLQNPTHSWSSAGTYYPTLKVQDETGMWSPPNGCTVYVVEPFTFVQVTDVHIGCKYVDVNPRCKKPTERSIGWFTSVINGTNKLTPEVDFVLITGDLVESDEPDFFYKFRNVLSSLDSSIRFYHIPGNHDRYTSYGKGNNLTNYHDCVKKNGPRQILIGPDNYTFEYGGYTFIGLDSGADCHFPYYWGTGLTEPQINGLRAFTNLEAPKIIFMHHPVFNDYSHGIQDWGIIANNRKSFITYCQDNNVQLVLTGHTHEDKIFNADGKRVGWNSNDRPLFIQTASVKDYSKCRVIEVNGYDDISIHPSTDQPICWKTSVWVDGIDEPVLHAYDSQGRHTGIDGSGNIVHEIPHSFYIGNYGTMNLEGIILYDADEDYKLTITLKDGLIVPKTKKLRQPENQSFNLTITNQTADSLTTISYNNITFTETTTATVNLNRTATNYTMAIDYNGDNITDETKDPDSIETDYEPTAMINTPVNNSIYRYGDQILFNGMGIDVEDGILTNTSLVWSSDRDGFIGIDCECNTTNLTAGTHIIALTVNDSSGQTDTDNVTLTVIAPDLAITNITFSNPQPIEGEAITINATIGNLGTVDVTDVTVQFFDGTPTNGTQIGTDQTIATLNAGENETVTVVWDSTDEAGDNCIWVVADPADTIKEPDEENNQASKNIFVGAPTVLHIVQAQTDRAAYIGNEAVLISCIVQNVSGNISANVSAEIEKPDSGMDSITMEEGIVGYYYGTFTNTSLSGRYNVTIYANRTGFVGDTESLWFEVLDTTPPASVTNITNTSGPTWINWTWDNPLDPDFDHTLIYLNGSWKTATAGNGYLADGLNASTEYEIATRTVDADGNINATWVNQTAETKVENLPPIANFTYSPQKPVVNQTIIFNASNSTDPDGNITKYDWDFGDGNITDTTEEIINHSYPLAGDYIVNLTVTDNDGATNATAKMITVSISSMPDLVITEKWVCWPDNCTICYNVTNTGDGTAPACHNTALYVDGVAVAQDHVPVDLAPGESYTGCFDGYVWTYTPPSDNITVCADNNEIVDELDEDNNCLTNIWMCGDVTGDGRVRTSDGRRIFRHLTFGDTIDNLWAADVTGDGRVRTSDGRRIFRHLTFGDTLNCNCSG